MNHETFAFINTLPWYKKLGVAKTVLDLPGMFIHEVSHVLMAVILFVQINEVGCKYFYKVENSTLETYLFYVVTTTPDTVGGRIRHALVNISPLIAVFVIVGIFPYLFIWVVFSWRTFGPSKMDWKNFKENVNHIINKKK